MHCLRTSQSLVFRRVLRGDGFARGTARLVSTASFAVLVVTGLYKGQR